jgi:uncharacterized metal-binding protein
MMLQLDYVGILVGFLELHLWVAFRFLLRHRSQKSVLVIGKPRRKIYESFSLTRKQIAAFSALTGLVLRSPWFQFPEWSNLRLASCISTGLSALAPIGHTWYLWGTFHLVGVGVPYYLLEGGIPAGRLLLV